MAINIANYERQTAILENVQSILNDLQNVGKKKRSQTFKTNGTWIAPAGVTEVFITGGGAGGGGGAQSSTGSGTGASGSSTSFSNLLTLAGGGGGSGSSQNNAPGGLSGGPGGGHGEVFIYSSTQDLVLGSGGSSGFYKGGTSAIFAGEYASRKGGYCSGGAGHVTINYSAGCGGGGDFVFSEKINVVPGKSYPVTIGVGGKGGATGAVVAGDGGNGILTIEWWE